MWEKHWQVKLALLSLAPLGILVWCIVYASLFQPYLDFVRGLKETRCTVAEVPRFDRREHDCGVHRIVAVEVSIPQATHNLTGCLYGGQIYTSPGSSDIESTQCGYNHYMLPRWSCARCEWSQCASPASTSCFAAVERCRQEFQVGREYKCFYKDLDGDVYLDPKADSVVDSVVIGLAVMSVACWVPVLAAVVLVCRFCVPFCRDVYHVKFG